jgi:glycosyltransferase involved in cell wall biosynthesis
MPIRGGRSLVLLALAVLLLGAGLLQVWSALATQHVVREAIRQTAAEKPADLLREKQVQDVIASRIQNAGKSLVETNLVGAISAGVAVVVSASGALIAVFGYLDTREKERTDRRLAQEKDRLDRLAASLNATIGQLVAGEARERIVGAAGLLPFFSETAPELHLQALAALIAAARAADESEEVRQGLRLSLEAAVRAVDPALLRRLSWQAVRLPRIDLRGCRLDGLDLRDAVLENARFQGASFIGADLTAAKLQGADLGRADLTRANLTYADLAGASLAGAVLREAVMDGVGLLNLDLEGADLRGLAGAWRRTPWDAARNWRRATFDDDVKAELEARYGVEAPETHVLMLMWEASPLVAGGTWTACWHLVRQLRRRGARVTVVIPWLRELVDDNPFGTDVELVGLGLMPPLDRPSPYAEPAWSPYGRPAPSWSPYSQPAWSAYAAPAWSPYSRPTAGWSPYGGSTGPYGYNPYGSTPLGLVGSTLYALMEAFGRRLETWLDSHRPDVIHAHDWVTFEAARAGAARAGVPWIAHFHSIEADRQPDATDQLTQTIERTAALEAARVVTPSGVTRDRLHQVYGIDPPRIDVIPNLLSAGEPAPHELGRFEDQRVVFIGRLSAQKGIDRFRDIALAAPGVRFEVFGEGLWPGGPNPFNLAWKGPLPWTRRGEAFAGASAVIVPSRFEPFGMVILEAMQHRVPVIYPKDSGAAEVLESGIKVDSGDVPAIAALVSRLLGDLTRWELTVRQQAAEIDTYSARGFDDRIIEVWQAARQADSSAATRAATLST